MRVRIAAVHWRQRVVIRHDDVRVRAGLQNAQRRVEIPSRDRRVAAKKHIRDLAPRDRRIAEMVLVDDVADLVAFEHVVRVAVGAET